MLRGPTVGLSRQTDWDTVHHVLVENWWAQPDENLDPCPDE